MEISKHFTIMETFVDHSKSLLTYIITYYLKKNSLKKYFVRSHYNIHGYVSHIISLKIIEAKSKFVSFDSFEFICFDLTLNGLKLRFL